MGTGQDLWQAEELFHDLKDRIVSFRSLVVVPFLIIYVICDRLGGVIAITLACQVVEQFL